MPNDVQSTSNIIVTIDAGQEVDADRLDRLTRQLRSELLDLDTESVELVTSEEIPAGTKSAEAISVGTIAIAVFPAFLPKVIEHLQSWTTREEQRKIKIKTQIGDRSIEVVYSPNTISTKELMGLVNTLTDSLVEEPKSD